MYTYAPDFQNFGPPTHRYARIVFFNLWSILLYCFFSKSAYMNILLCLYPCGNLLCPLLRIYY